jgi:cellulose biosynthesis protein BcsQ
VDIKTICVASVKGGVGKTTTAYALAAAAVAKGMVVAAIDLDGARGLSRALGLRQSRPTILDVLTRRATVTEALVRTELGVLALPGDRDLYQIGFNDGDMFALHAKLASADLVIIDTHPGQSRLEVALAMADTVVIPAILDEISFDVAAETLQVIETAGELEVVGGFLNSNFRPSDHDKTNENLLAGISALDVVYDNYLTRSQAWPKAMARGIAPGRKPMAQASRLLAEVLSKRASTANLLRFLRAWETAQIRRT